MIQGIIFDYGGTIDTGGRHWADVIWQGYQACQADVNFDNYRLAYVHAERSLAKFPLIQPDFNFLQLLRIKLNIQTSFLVDAKMWPALEKDEPRRVQLSDDIARHCYDYVVNHLQSVFPVLDQLAQNYPLVLVSNFYGNLPSVLRDFRLDGYFQSVVESAVVGCRKPDPRIFQLGINTLGLPADHVVVVGDSLSKDIQPATTLRCRTVWMQGTGWEGPSAPSSLPSATITDLAQLPLVLQKWL